MSAAFCAGAYLAAASWSPAHAATFDGRAFDDVRIVDGQPLVLSGLGKRVLIVLDLYYALLYVPTPVADYQALRESRLRQLEIQLLRDVRLGDIEKVFTDGLTQNVATDELAQIRVGIEELLGAMRAKRTFARGDILRFTFDGNGTRIEANGQELTKPVAGKMFNDALMSIWFGPNPIDARLKRQLLTRPSN